MAIMDKINELVSIINYDEKLEVLNIVISLTEYATLVTRVEMNANMHSTRSEIEDAKIEDKYSLCVKQVNRLNDLSKEFLGENIYNQSLDRKEIEDFLLEILSEIYGSRKISRR